MNVDTIINTIKTLGKDDFDVLVRLVLKQVFSLDPLNVDASGDGGSDWLICRKADSNPTVAYQVTVQDKKWEDKARFDAEKAVKKLKCTRYLFLTSQLRRSAELRRLELGITGSLGIPATCFGARELAEFVVDYNPFPSFCN